MSDAALDREFRERYRLEEFLSPPPQRFTHEEGEFAADEWGFNCGPAALCVVLGMTPAELRPFLGDLETKRYTNPTLMFDTLKRIGVEHQAEARNRLGGMNGAPTEAWPRFGLVRIQWGGPWTKPGVPMRVRYRHTHWVASWWNHRNLKHAIYDVNLAHQGGWATLSDWRDKLVPWLLQECEPKADGTWWLTHAVTIPVERYGNWTVKP